MCRLFGLIANNEVDIEFSFLKANKSFRELSKKNPHGWGVGYYIKNNAKVYKEPFSASKSIKFLNIAGQIKSKIVVSHVRFSTQGKKAIKNTHPFKDKNWIFAHNGNVDIRTKLIGILNPNYKNKIMGETDSEVLFYWLLQNIEENKNIIEGIKKGISFIESNKGDSTTSLNFILTNGENLFALRKAFCNINHYSLYYLCRDPNKVEISDFKSEETRQLIKSKRLRGEKSVLICSEKLTNEENWKVLANNHLFIVNCNLKPRISEV